MWFPCVFIDARKCIKINTTYAQMHIYVNALQYNSERMIRYPDSYEYLMETNSHKNLQLFCTCLSKQLFCCRKNVFAS